MTSLMIIKRGQPLANSLEMAKIFNVDHRSIKRMVDSNLELFEEDGKVESFLIRFNKKEQKAYLLNEPQCLLLLTFMKNSVIIKKLKRKLITEFTRIKKALQKAILNKQNQKWLEDRTKGKLARSYSVEQIEKFVQYATNQGSKNAVRYYANISKMENKALFIISERYPNTRDMMSKRQLFIIQGADAVAVEAIREGMKKEMNYKDIYELAKKRVESYAELMPQTIIPQMSQEELDKITLLSP